MKPGLSVHSTLDRITPQELKFIRAKSRIETRMIEAGVGSDSKLNGAFCGRDIELNSLFAQHQTGENH